MAEKEAWKIAKEHGLDLVTIHPVFVVGPVLSDRTDATSVQMIKVRVVGAQSSPAQYKLCHAYLACLVERETLESGLTTV